IAGCAIARMTRQGTSVGPGIIRIGRSSPRRPRRVLTRHLLLGCRTRYAPAAAILGRPGVLSPVWPEGVHFELGDRLKPARPGARGAEAPMPRIRTTLSTL